MSGRDFLLFLGMFAAWYAVSRFLLPRMGVPT